MMTAEDNELLCRVDNNAPMGKMLGANYWFPATLSCELIADGKPLIVKLMGKRYVAFRATNGQVGIFDEHCPHRGASLVLGRNEDNALECIFHGWKFGVDGTVRDVPTQLNNKAEFCKAVPLKHYPVREAAGVVWVWLNAGVPRPFPAFEFMNLPENQVHLVRQHVRCNWVQDVEAGMDSAHIAILHKSWLQALNIPLAGVDLAPVYEFEAESSGFRYAAIRNLPDSRQYIRINQFVMPWYSFICPETTEGDRLVIMSTPIDDTNTFHWMMRYNRVRPLQPSFINPVASLEERTNYPPRPPGGPDEGWGQDRGAMARGHFTGFAHVNTEDFAIIESQGQILDRTREFLNPGDRAVVLVRRNLLDAVREAEAGKQPKLADHENIQYTKIKADVLTITKGDDWRAALKGTSTPAASVEQSTDAHV